jgi:predicted MPP superfamily phosphohydrolase
VLENQAIRLARNGRPFWLIGLGDQLANNGRRFGRHGVDDLPRALREVHDDAPAILLAHEPHIFPRAPDRIALTLCGHTHGGQINLPLLGSPFMRGEPGQKPYVYGVYSEGARQLVVSGGLGASYVPVRILRPPEVVTLDLTGTAGA